MYPYSSIDGWDTSSVASRAWSELTSSQCNWKGNRKGKGTDETPHNRPRSFFSVIPTGQNQVKISIPVPRDFSIMTVDGRYVLVL